MKKAAVGLATVAALIGTSAFAADMPDKAPPPPSIRAPGWTGFYVGGNVGGAWGNFDPSTVAVLNPAGLVPANAALVTALGTTLSIKPDAFVGGFQAGYNWQAANFVYGLEADIESFHLSGSSNSVGALLGPVTFTLGASASTTWLATARGRIGFAANNWLLYATGGAAFTHLNGSFTYADAIPNTEAASFSGTKTGYTVGGGIEAGIGGGWSAKAEYLYVNFGSVSGSGNLSAPLSGQVLNHSIDLKANIARGGLNYRFN